MGDAADDLYFQELKHQLAAEQAEMDQLKRQKEAEKRAFNEKIQKMETEIKNLTTLARGLARRVTQLEQRDSTNMIDPKGLMMIEPKKIPTKIIHDQYTDLAKNAWKEAKQTGRAFKGIHTCICGYTSDNLEWTIRGIKTNSLLVHYVASHREEVPQSELDKLIQFETK